MGKKSITKSLISCIELRNKDNSIKYIHFIKNKYNNKKYIKINKISEILYVMQLKLLRLNKYQIHKLSLYFNYKYIL